jgi:hypothetical protein
MGAGGHENILPRIRECRRPSRTPYKNTQILIGVLNRSSASRCGQTSAGREWFRQSAFMKWTRFLWRKIQDSFCPSGRKSSRPRRRSPSQASRIDGFRSGSLRICPSIELSSRSLLPRCGGLRPSARRLSNGICLPPAF